MSAPPFALLILVLGLASQLHAANLPDSPQGPDPSGALRETVASLAEMQKRSAGDYAQMAEETISFGSNPEAVTQLNGKVPDRVDPNAPWRNVVNDALAAVDEGEHIDPQAANWPELRERLKQLQPPPPPPSQGGSKKDKKDQKNQKKDKKKQKGAGKDKQQQSGGGQKSEEQDQSGGEGAEGECESEGPPSQGQSGRGNKQGGQQGGGSEASGESEEKESQNEEGKAKDGQAKPGRKDGQDQGEATMDQPGRGETAGFEKFGSGEPRAEMEKGGETENKNSLGTENDVAMRKVGGGTGKKEEAFGFGEPDPQSVSRLLQVKQADSPAVLQQNLDLEKQEPKPSSQGKPW
jgi:hypothetical protein